MLQAFIGILVGIGLYLIAADLLKIPFIKTSKAVVNLSKRQKKKTSSLELWLQNLSSWMAGKIHINKYKKLQLQSDLKTAGINLSPEQYTANALLKAGICGIFAVPAFVVFPLLSPVLILIAIGLYFKESKGIQDKIRRKRTAIEYELPRLVFTIDKTLTHNRDILSILDSYRKNAGLELKDELNITVADMRSGNYESALTRLEARVGSSMLSDVVRGLISVLRGDNTEMYWASLSVKFADVQRQILKQQAIKVPSKVKRLSMVLLFCFILVYMVVIVVQIMLSLNAMFG
ncbi:MAG TPA: secretion protein F [Ruminococcaceae bacterium]|nr:secretion protein F [Oscillospiraceae bacterium]